MIMHFGQHGTEFLNILSTEKFLTDDMTKKYQKPKCTFFTVFFM